MGIGYCYCLDCKKKIVLSRMSYGMWTEGDKQKLALFLWRHATHKITYYRSDIDGELPIMEYELERD